MTQSSTMIHSTLPQKIFTNRRHGLIVFLLGMSCGWFGLFYAIYFYEKAVGHGAGTCIAGIHLHHMFVGMLIFFFASIYTLIILKKFPQNYNAFQIGIFVMGIGFGSILDDVFDHFIFKDSPFELYCH